jgi:hypothetical protein
MARITQGTFSLPDLTDDQIKSKLNIQSAKDML